MSIKKLYKITKITQLSNPVENMMGIAQIFRLFSNSKRVRLLQGTNQLHLRRKKNHTNLPLFCFSIDWTRIFTVDNLKMKFHVLSPFVVSKKARNYHQNYHIVIFLASSSSYGVNILLQVLHIHNWDRDRDRDMWDHFCYL